MRKNQGYRESYRETIILDVAIWHPEIFNLASLITVKHEFLPTLFRNNSILK